MHERPKRSCKSFSTKQSAKRASHLRSGILGKSLHEAPAPRVPDPDAGKSITATKSSLEHPQALVAVGNEAAQESVVAGRRVVQTARARSRQSTNSKLVGASSTATSEA